jgi:hypothetical protein
MRAVCGGADGRVTHVLLSRDVPARPRTLENAHPRGVACVAAVDNYAVCIVAPYCPQHALPYSKETVTAHTGERWRRGRRARA